MISNQNKYYYYILSYKTIINEEDPKDKHLIGDGIVIIDRFPVKFSAMGKNYFRITDVFAQSLINFLRDEKKQGNNIKLRVLEKMEGTESCRFVTKGTLCDKTNEKLKEDIIKHTNPIDNLSIYRCEVSNPLDDYQFILVQDMFLNSLIYYPKVDSVTDECMIFEINDHHKKINFPLIILVEKVYEINNK